MLTEKLKYLLVVMLFPLILVGCSTTPSERLIAVKTSKIKQELLVVPISKSLLRPCSELYPLVEFSPVDTLKNLYKNIMTNLGQVRKCYRKDEALINEVIEKEETLLESIRNNS